ncbi:MAG: LacI family transcriptional regulator [Kiritimatiellales bacterium]|nr:LacI family transcriptional regulator [Kiritimatiellales bacterium]MCF7864813.1 LacI family transcriptional regulator [Kiritimatiellales bacterium]
MNVSQKKIAEKLGVSISLVSRVLSGRAAEIGIAQPTIDKVITTAQAMGYVPNVAAQSLKGKSTRMIGVVVYDFKDPFFGTVVHHLQSLAHEHNYTLLLVGFQNRNPDERDLRPLSKFNLDGIIAVGSDLTESWPENFAHLPLARIGFGNENIHSLKITSDESAGYGQLVGYLRTMGIGKAAFLGADTELHRKRSAFFEAAAATLDVASLFDPDREHSSFEVGRELTTQLIQNGLPDVLVCGNDRIAMGAIHAAADAGIRVPEKLKVVGYDDIPAATQFLPPLTTIRQPIAAIAKEAFESVVKGACPNETRLLVPELIIRHSA